MIVLHMFKERNYFCVSIRLGIVFEHAGEDTYIRVRCDMKNVAGVAGGCKEARALGKEKCHPVILVVQGVLDELCMELSKTMEIGYFAC